MKLVSRLYNQAASFSRDENGSIVPMTAVLMTAVMLSAGVALDFTRVANTKTKMDTALDSAVLAAGTQLMKGVPVDDKFEQDFRDFFHSNIVGRGGFVNDYEITSFSADADTGQILATAEANIDATLMRLAGYETLDTSSVSGGVFQRTDTEITMMLDVTGSMGGSKIRDLKAAASDAVNILLPDDNTQGTRIGLVPYSWSVNAGDYADDVTWGNRDVAVAGDDFASITNNTPTTSCVTERGGINASNDASYTQSPLGSDFRAVDGDLCPDLEIQPLTNNKSRLLSDIDDMKAQGYTAGHLGIAWSYYMLSENWRSLWPSSADPAPYGNKVKKIAILMTDGEFNTYFDGTSGNPYGPNAALSNQSARDICADMKAAKDGNPGITIYSVAFQAPASAEATLRDCANEDTAGQTFYYSADNGEELNEAFRAIANDIQALRLNQ